jgi:hypothetical protein
MTTPNSGLRLCACGHSQDDHVLALVLKIPAPMGVMLCPDCPCGSTWRANTRRSTPEEVTETRRLVRAELLRFSIELPEFLR